VSSAARTVGHDNASLRASLEDSQALVMHLTTACQDGRSTIAAQARQIEQQDRLIARFTMDDSATTVYYGPTERLEERTV
jgi:hypothetical protein